MIDTVLVANRGEIAVRIIRTCRRLGVRTIAVYSDADRGALHVLQADGAVHIGPSPAAESYLNQEAIIDAAHARGAGAIHPGYGFLSENAEFAERVQRAGLVWVGPPPEAMRAVGDKARAKALAELHGVPVLPGYHGVDQAPAVLRTHADRMGYPVLIKASAGGGGRGMRVVASAAEFDAALEAAQREAQASFGDRRVLLERYIRRPRHIEVQILGDQHGQLIHLGERECSIQRRHQKLIEESPSPMIGPELRERMGDAALRLARAAGYQNAGTVEFLVDDDQRFAFLEVNARLQVEHPVTEAITSLDLVELQLRIASGEPLPVRQEDVTFDGHAVEVRVIAEDPSAGFLPSSGTIELFVPPLDVRLDTWIATGTRVTPHYDSLLAKIIAHGSDRATTVRLLARALRETWIDGVADNIDLLLATIEHPEFLSGQLSTDFLEQHAILSSLDEVPPPVIAAVSGLDALRPMLAADPWTVTSGWRIGRVDQPTNWTRAGHDHPVTVSALLADEGVEVRGPDTPAQVRQLGHHGREWTLEAAGEKVAVWGNTDRRVAEWQQHSYRFRAARPLTIDQTGRDRGPSGAGGRLSAPMPARVVKIAVAEGERVRQNQTLVVLEAMKMEHVVEAPRAGIVTALCVAVGDQLQRGAQLLTLGAAELQ